jgi:hypothetical protein
MPEGGKVHILVIDLLVEAGCLESLDKFDSLLGEDALKFLFPN